MNTKSLGLLASIACVAIVSVATSAAAQNRRYWQPDEGYQDDYRGGYREDYRGGYRPDYGYASRGRCLTSDGINDSLARNGWYPIALVGQSGNVLHMHVAGGGRQFTAAVDRCTGRVLQMWGPPR